VALYSTRTGLINPLTASATKSLWLLNPVSDFFVIAQVAGSFKASAASDTVGMELYRTTTLGTPAGTTATFSKVNRVGDAAAPTTTGLVNLTTEPTAVEVLADWEIQPFGGLLDVQYPLQREPIGAAAGQRIGLRVITPAAVTPGVRSYVWLDER
jgi:hypothetical protein